MVTRNIICMGCDFDGKVEAHDTVGVPETDIFKSLGKSDTGYLLFRCPSCGKDIAVDPLKAFLSRKMKGYPVNKEESIEEHFEDKREKEVEIDFSQRVPCSDGNCIGVINEQGVCNTCGKPYIPTNKDNVIKTLKDTMDYDDVLDMNQKQILKLAKNNFILWLISIIFVFIARSTSKGFLNVITLIILVLMLIKSIKLSVLIKNHFNIIYEMYGPHPNEKRNSLITSFINIGIIGLAILLFTGGSNWHVIVPLILLSFMMFGFLGASLSGGGAK